MVWLVARNHIAEDTLERYVMARLSEAELVPVEEHLLICQDCRERVAWLDDFVGAVRSAARAASRGAGAGHEE
jgi:anti-sigma factor RsiW